VSRYFPLARGYFIASPFGPRDGGFHAGTDFGWLGGSGGLPIYACQSGTVLYAGAASGYGGPDPRGWVVIDSTDAEGGGCAEYGHLVREVSVGDHVQAGQRIAHINPDSGSNGGVPPHCHLSIMPRGYDPATKIDPLLWLGQAAYPAEQPTGGTVPNFPIIGGDSAQAITPELMDQMGAEFWCRYLCTFPASNMDFKRSTPGEIDRIVAGGKKVVHNWETDGRPDDGFATGVSAAQDADAECNDRHTPGAPVIFSFADPDSSEPDIPKVLQAIDGAVSVIGWDRVGLYGRFDVIKAMFDGNHCKYGWQTYGQSYGQWDPRAQLRQCSNALTDHGVGHDYDEAWADDYGQWPRPNAAPATPTANPVLGGLVSDLTPDEQHEVLFALRDIRMQLCGSATPGEYPGFGQLGVVNGDGTPGAPRTVVDALGSLLNVPNPYSKQLEPAGQALGFLEQRTTGHADYWGKQVMAALASNPAVSPDVKAAVLAQLASLSITLTPKAV